ncbi:hypothetical protein ABKN59_006484 [Abortiporus biennis]
MKIPMSNSFKEQEEVPLEDITLTENDKHNPDRNPIPHTTTTASAAAPPTSSSSDEEEDIDNSDDDSDDSEDEAKNIQRKHKKMSALWSAFMKLSRPVRVLLVGSLGAGIFITPLLVFKLRFNSSPARIQAHVWSLWLTISWGAGCVTFLAVDFALAAVMFLIERFSNMAHRWKMALELTGAVMGWLKLTLSISWMWVALSIIRITYRPPGNYWSIINRVMQALFSASILLLAEKVTLHYIATNFHRKALSERIEENKLGLEALDRLSRAKALPGHRRGQHGHGHGKQHGSEGNNNRSFSINVLGYGGRNARGHDLRLSQGNGMREGNSGGGTASTSTTSSPDGSPDIDSSLLGNQSPPLTAQTPGFQAQPIGNVGGEREKESGREKERRKKKKKRSAVTSVIVDGIGGAIGQVALKDSKFNREGIFAIHSPKKFARKLFHALAHDKYGGPSDYLVEDDFIPYFPSKADAIAAFKLFDKDGNKNVTAKEMRNAIRRIYQERKDLTRSLKDVSHVVGILDFVLSSLAIVILIFVCLLIFNKSNTLASLVPLATIILGFSFIFGHSAQMIFESLVFIFSTHVFDVGDLVMIDDSPMFVREFGLFATTFQRVDGQTLIAPNTLLATSKIVHNFRRSGSMWESTELMISYQTSLSTLSLLNARLKSYADQHSRDWTDITIQIDKMEYQNATHLLVLMGHKPNWQDWGGRWERRTKFMKFLKSVLEELDVRYTMPVQPVVLPPGQFGRLMRGYGGGGGGRDGAGRLSPDDSMRSERSEHGVYPPVRRGPSIRIQDPPPPRMMPHQTGGGVEMESPEEEADLRRLAPEGMRRRQATFSTEASESTLGGASL